MCTYRAKCYSTRLSWELDLAEVRPFIQDKMGSLIKGENMVLATIFMLD